ncbi:MAG: substrate-binding domain-containing protein [Cyanobacteria bacterium REEB67]|nr:substrate-binding domain-containing protein [Cyanobacteria bacterium REEB67]
MSGLFLGTLAKLTLEAAAMTPWIRSSKSHVAAALVVAALGLGACATPSKSGQLTVAVIPMGTTDEYWKMVHAGAVQAGRKLGVEIIWQGPIRRDDRTAQIDVVENLLVRGVSGIVLAPVDNMALRGPVEDARRQGVPTVIIDSDLQSDKFVSFVATDNVKGGAMAADHLARLLDGHGKVAILRNVEGNASTDHREAGFLDALKKYPGLEVVSSNQHAGATAESAYKASENLLAKLRTTDGKPGVDGVFCPNESSAFGMLRALQDGELAGKIHFIGFDSSKKLLEAVAHSQVDALVVQNPMQIAYLGVATLVDHLHKKPIAARVDVPATLVTKENLNEPAIQELVAPDMKALLGESK